MTRPRAELIVHLEDLARDLEVTERLMFQRRMLPTLELEAITMRREMAQVKGIDR